MATRRRNWGRVLIALMIGAMPVAGAPIHGAAARSAPKYAVADLGLPDGSASTWAFNVNNKGVAVGWDALPTTDPQNQSNRPVWAASGGTFALLEGPDVLGVANDINDRGKIVGWAYVSTSSTIFHAVLWFKGKRTDLSTLGGDNSYADAINGKDVVVGQADVQPGPKSPSHAFTWAKGTMTDLGTLGGPDSVAGDINDAGHVVGYSTTSKGDQHAFFWDGATMTDLGTLPGGDTSEAQAINKDGLVVGSSTTAPGQTLDKSNSHAFVWRRGVMTELPMLKGSVACWAYGVNDAGLIVGACDKPTSSTRTTAVLWTNGTVVELNTLVPGNTGWNVDDAYGVNNNGQIAGDGDGPGAPTLHGLVLTPSK